MQAWAHGRKKDDSTHGKWGHDAPQTMGIVLFYQVAEFDSL